MVMVHLALQREHMVLSRGDYPYLNEGCAMGYGLKTEWERRRGFFNHDWLVNDYLRELSGFLARLDDLKLYRAGAAQFLRAGFAQWQQQRSEAKWLCEHFEAKMSPRVLFEDDPKTGLPYCPPLRRLSGEHQAWLGEVAHMVWLAQGTWQDKLTAFRNQLANCEKIFRELMEELAAHATDDVEAAVPLRPKFIEFHKQLTNLSDALSQLPHEVFE